MGSCPRLCHRSGAPQRSRFRPVSDGAASGGAVVRCRVGVRCFGVQALSDGAVSGFGGGLSPSLASSRSRFKMAAMKRRVIGRGRWLGPGWSWVELQAVSDGEAGNLPGVRGRGPVGLGRAEGGSDGAVACFPGGVAGSRRRVCWGSGWQRRERVWRGSGCVAGAGADGAGAPARSQRSGSDSGSGGGGGGVLSVRRAGPSSVQDRAGADRRAGRVGVCRSGGFAEGQGWCCLRWVWLSWGLCRCGRVHVRCHLLPVLRAAYWVLSTAI